MERINFAHTTGSRGPEAVPRLPRGEEAELLRIGGTAGAAQLSVLSGEVNEAVARLQVGDFTVVAIRRAGSPLTMLICSVGAHSWLLARDSPVLRVGPRKFTFAFPGYFLALALPEGCFDRDVGKLETILVTFCTCANIAGERDSDFCVRKPETNFWASAYTEIRRLSLRSPPQVFPHDLTRPPAATQWSWQHATLNFQRASRTSAATKLVARILTANADPSDQIEVMGPIGAVTAAFSRGTPYIFPSLRAVSDIVDAMEAARGIGTGNWTVAPDRWGSIPDGIMYWHFKVSGVMQLLRAVANFGERNRASGCMLFGTGLLAELVGGGVCSCSHGHLSGRPAGGDVRTEENVNGTGGSVGGS